MHSFSCFDDFSVLRPSIKDSSVSPYRIDSPDRNQTNEVKKNKSPSSLTIQNFFGMTYEI